MAPDQLPLGIGHPTALSAEDFLVSGCNAEAMSWIERWPDWPAPALVLWGPPGCGKTHLAEIWRARSGAPLIDGPDLAGGDPEGLAEGPHLGVERADRADERALLRLYNLLGNWRGSLLLTAPEPPARWSIRIPDLASRLRAAPAAAIRRPDDALMQAVMAKQFADRQIDAPQDVLDLLVRRLERSFAAMRDAVDRLDAAALAGRRGITTGLVRDLFAGERHEGRD